MSFLNAPDILVDRPLAGQTTFGIGGAADYFALPATCERAVELIVRARAEEVKVRLLGGGSNLLVGDGGVRGLVVKLPSGQLRARGARVMVPAGMPLARAIDACRRRGLSGLEELAGVPGTVGGAAVMNAGAFGREFGELAVSAGVLDDGWPQEFSKGSCRFAYRSSGLSGKVVLWVELELAESPPRRVSRRIREILAERRRRFPSGRSAGCIFRNGRVRAGALIDALGLKGASRGGARVSRKHANFIVNSGGATADDVLGLISMVRTKALAEAGVKLDLEVEVWDR